MEHLQARALDALQPFIALSRSANSARAAAEVVTRATSASGTYVFAELLDTPSIQSLETAEAEYSSYLTLLQIFAWGTLQDYKDTPNLPKLNAQQLQKLRQLSLLSLCNDVANLRYHTLQAALGLSSARALEDLVISATNAGLITAKLSPSTSVVYVSSVSSLRDLAPGSATHLLEAVLEWDSNCDDILTDIDEQIRDIRQKANERSRNDGDMHKAVDKAGSGAESRSAKRAAADHGGIGIGGSRPVVEDGDDEGHADDHMDIDDDELASGGRDRDRSNGVGAVASQQNQPRKNARARTGGALRR